MPATHTPEVQKIPHRPMMPGRPSGIPEIEDGDDESEVGQAPNEQIIRDINRIIRDNSDPEERPDIDPREEPGRTVN